MKCARPRAGHHYRDECMTKSNDALIESTYRAVRADKGIAATAFQRE